MPRDQSTFQTVPPRKRVSVFIKIFVVMHLIAIISWCLPPPPKGKPGPIDTSTPLKAVQGAGRVISDGTLYVNNAYVKQSPAKFYLLFTGFWQYWDMFSPNPSNIDFYGTAMITYRDGATKPYNFPRIYTMGVPEKYVSERYRKYYERAHTEDDKWIWPTFAQRVALLNYNNPMNPPVKVVLTRNFYRIPQPPEMAYQTLLNEWQRNHSGATVDEVTKAELWERAKDEAAQKAEDRFYKRYSYYTYDVDLVRLDREKSRGIFG
jgi:hypothetical protein